MQHVTWKTNVSVENDSLNISEDWRISNESDLIFSLSMNKKIDGSRFFYFLQ